MAFDVLRLLSEHEFRSGQALAAHLDVSRSSIWGALNAAQAAGVRIHRVHGRGYRLGAMIDWLDAERIACATSGADLTLHIVNCCASTNAALLSRPDDTVSGTVLAAELQTQGRGRLGRRWQSGFASALTFSVLWRFTKGIAGLAGLSLAVGLAIARVLQREGVQAQLKWPNDIVWHGRKLGGVLIEVRGEALGPCIAVIGVGLNIRLDEAERQRIDQPVVDLVEAVPTHRSRNDWLAMILVELARSLRSFAVSGFEPLREDWSRHCAHHNEPVRLALPDGSEALGVARGVDAQGRLLVESGGRCASYLSADVSLRPAYDSRG